MTITKPFNKLFDANQIGTSISSLVPKIALPAGAGVIPTDDIGQSLTDDFLTFLFFGSGAANGTGTARITGWKLCKDLWIPIPLLNLDFILGASTGVSGKEIKDTDFFADTIAPSSGYALTDGTALPDAQIVSPADDRIAYVKVDPFGCRYIQVQVAKGGTSTGVNGAVSWFGEKYDS